MRVVVVLGLATACGRIDFDPRALAGDGGTSDAPSLDQPLVHARSALFDARCNTDVFSSESITADADGNVYVAGCASGTGAFGAFPYTTTAPETGYIAALDRDLGPLQLRVFAATVGTAGVFEIGYADGSIYTMGIFDTAIDIGTGPLSSLGADDVFAARYAPRTLVHQWSTTFGSSSDDDGGYGLALFGDGSIVVGGGCNGSFSFGGPNLVGADGDPCIGIVRDDTELAAYRWPSTSFGGVYSLAVVPGGDVAIAGYYTGVPPFPMLGADAMSDGFVARVAQDGTVRWAEDIIGSGDDAAVEVEVDANGDVYAVGHANSAVKIAGRLMTFAGVYDGWIARFDPSGALLWARMIGGSGDDELRNVAIVGDSVVIAGNFSGTITVGNEDLTSSGDTDIVVAALAREDGSVRWARRFGGAGQDRVRSMIRDGDRFYLTGIATPPVDFGGGSLAGTAPGVFVLALAPP